MRDAYPPYAAATWGQLPILRLAREAALSTQVVALRLGYLYPLLRLWHR